MFLDKLFEQEMNAVVPVDEENKAVMQAMSEYADFVTYTVPKLKAYMTTADQISEAHPDIPEMIFYASVIGAAAGLGVHDPYPAADIAAAHFNRVLPSGKVFIAILSHDDGTTLFATAGRYPDRTTKLHTILVPADMVVNVRGAILEYADNNRLAYAVYEADMHRPSVYEWRD